MRGDRVALTAEAALARTQVLYDEINGRRRSVQLADDYYRGKQRLRFATEKWAEYHAARYKDFSDNWCAPVANSPNERLRVEGFKLDQDPGQSDDEKSLWRDWQANDMDAQSSQGWLSSIITGRSYVQVWGDDEAEPVATWERADQMTIGYDPERPGVAIDQLKTWHDGTTEFATYSTPELVWKWERPYLDHTPAPVREGEVPPRAAGFFETTSGILVPSQNVNGWKMRQPSRDNTWPLPNPLGVLPAVEMPNRPMLGGEPLSDIAGTMAMQDSINLLWAYLFNAADQASMKARVVMGLDKPSIPILDASGNEIGRQPVDLKKLSEDRILWLEGDGGSIGEWEAARLDVFTGVIEVQVTHVAAQTRTPPHYLVLGKGMVNVNADGMRAAETGLVKKVEEEQLFLSPGVRGYFQRTALVRGNKDLAKQCRFGTVGWRGAENHSRAQLVDGLQKLSAIGFPFAWIAEQYGLSQPDVARVLGMREAEMESDPVGMASRLIGQSNGTPPKPLPEP